MKPKIGQKVYSVSPDDTYAYKETVGYLGKDSFVVDGYDYHGADYQERFYDGEGISWFASLKDLKQAYPTARYDRSEGRYELGERK